MTTKMNARKIVITDTSDEWMQRTWRPMMAILYMGVCGFDFILAPILWSVLQANNHGVITSQWIPITLQGGGLFHLAMGTVLGITAYGRTQEKIKGVTSNYVIDDSLDGNNNNNASVNSPLSSTAASQIPPC